MKKYLHILALTLILVISFCLRQNVYGAEENVQGVSTDDILSPLVSYEYPEPDYEEEGIIYYTQFKSVSVNISDKREYDSGLKNISISANDIGVYNGNYDEAVNEKSISVNIVEYAYENICRLNVIASDCEGNETISEKLIVRDSEAPEITEIVSDTQIDMLSFDDIYGLYDISAREFVIRANDGEYGSGFAGIYYCFVSEDEEPYEEEYSNAENKATITLSIDPDFKGRLFVKPVDNVGNKGEWTATGYFVLETDERFDSEIDIRLKFPDTDCRDREGNRLYSDDIDLVIDVSECYGGVKRIVYEITDQGKTIGIGEYIPDDTPFEAVEKERNKINISRGRIHIEHEANNMEIRVRVYGNNGSYNEIREYFSIDKTPPTITTEEISSGADTVYEGYYNSDVIIRTCSEDINYDEEGVIFTSSKAAQFYEYSVIDNTCTADNVFSDEAAYTYEVCVTDLAGNTSEVICGDFVIDRTPPFPEYEINGEESRYCYNYERNANVVIYETNPAPERITWKVISSTGEYEFPEMAYDGEGVLNAQLSFCDDGVYEVYLTAADKVGNTSETMHIPMFIIDMTEPALDITGVENAGEYNRSVIPYVYANDENYSSGALEVSLTNLDDGEYTEYAVAKSDIGEEVNVPEIKADGRYELRADVFDMAGNRAENTIRFTVNTEGSSYDRDCVSAAYNNRYVREACDIKLYEFNRSRLLEDSINISVTYNGRIMDDISDYLDRYVTYRNGKYEYEYVLSKEIFERDGVYTVTADSVDEAGNYNYSMSMKNNLRIRFGVDNTPPVAIPVGINDGDVINASEYTVCFSVNDNMELESAQVYADGQASPCIIENGKVNITLNESSEKRDIVIYVYDKAGNSTEVTLSGILISTNPFVRLYYNRSLLAGLFMELVGVGGLAAGRIMKKI